MIVSNFQNSKICMFFIHGFCSGPEDWVEQEKFFGNIFTVFCPTLRGHDGKNDLELPMSIEQLTMDCAKIMENHNDKKFIFIGHSMGTRIAINLSYKFRKRTLGLVLVDGSKFADIENFGEVISHFEKTIFEKDYLFLLKQMFSSMFFNKKFNNDRERIINRAIGIPVKYSLALRRNVIWFDAHCLKDLLSKINIPILILHSTKLDNKRIRSPIKNNEKIDYVEFIKSLTLTLESKTFKNTGHYISLEEPELLNKTIFKWMKKL